MLVIWLPLAQICKDLTLYNLEIQDKTQGFYTVQQFLTTVEQLLHTFIVDL